MLRLAVLLFAIVAIVVTAISALNRPARGQDHHPLHRDFYHHWKEPGTDRSCCNARVVSPWGGEVGDCEPSQAEIRNGDWYVWIRQIREWKRVPDEKILREKNPNTFDAHLCWTQVRGIICFVPPSTGG